MLDVPNFFWDSEPTLYPLYIAVREYLEIKPRIQVLNERCRVFLDLIEILSDSIADSKMSRMSVKFYHGLCKSMSNLYPSYSWTLGVARNKHPTPYLIFTFTTPIRANMDNHRPHPHFHRHHHFRSRPPLRYLIYSFVVAEY